MPFSFPEAMMETVPGRVGAQRKEDSLLPGGSGKVPRRDGAKGGQSAESEEELTAGSGLREDLMEFHSCHPHYSAMARSQFTTTSTSRVQGFSCFRLPRYSSSDPLHHTVFRKSTGM
ncbi:hypothetical protein AAY473_030937 [Plecturocebus cupreus]